MSVVLGECPATLGFRMPAEWEPHAATWMVWPHNRADWEIKTRAVEWCYVEIIRHLVPDEHVALICQSEAVRDRAMARLERAGVLRSAYRTYCIKTNRSWIRDSGPIFLTSTAPSVPSIAVSDWVFNGWARYRSYDDDHRVPCRIADTLGIPRFVPNVEQGDRVNNVVLEGGSIDVNGCGDLLATEECLLGESQARNPNLSRVELETVLHNTLGARRVHWLVGGIDGDDTHGHIDDVARFVAPNRIVAAVEDCNDDINHDVLQRNLGRLQQMKNGDGDGFDIIPIAMPKAVFFDGMRLPASYLNFYIGNSVVLVPTFNDSRDSDALALFKSLFPTREVVGIYAGDLILGLGAIHCVTQQQPVGYVSESEDNRD